MKFERTPMPSQEDMAKIEKERVLSDAEFLKGGAEYKFNKEGEKSFLVTEEQIKEAYGEKQSLDLGDYVKLHKEIKLPYDEITDEDLKSEVLSKKGHYFIIRFEREDKTAPSYISYITKKGDCATVRIDTEKIDSLKDTVEEDNKPWINVNVVLEEKLKELGFQKSGAKIHSEVSKESFEEIQKNQQNSVYLSVRKTGEISGEGYHNISLLEESWKNDEEKEFFIKIFKNKNEYEEKLSKEMAQNKKEKFDF